MAKDPNVGGGQDRTKIPKANFVFPEDAPDGGFPVVTAGDVSDAVSSWGRYKGPHTFDEFKARLTALAKRLGFASSLPDAWKSGNKKAGDLKAEPMDSGQLDRWLGGKIPRRILMLPFGGKLKAELWGYPPDDVGRDLDGDYADKATDIYGPFPSLRASRDRLVDWHHNDWGVENIDPRASRMKGAIIGKAVIDPQPEDDGYWADWWANAGEQRLALVAQLERLGTHLYGSTQAVKSAIVRSAIGHLDVWPIFRHTISTSPQNTLAVVPPLKALLAADIPDDVGYAAVKAALTGFDAGQRLGKSSPNGGSGFRSDGDRSGTARASKAERKAAALALQFMERYQARHQETP